jgi:acid stress-induced BolA-like protein IbaG/YrbA
MEASVVQDKVQQALPQAQVHVEGEGDRFDVTVVSPEFEGVPRVQQHRKVYTALGEDLRGELHALTVKTFTPEQFQSWVAANNPS